MTSDSSTAYENHAREYLRARDVSAVGVDVIERWSRSLGTGAEVLEIACGGGLPVTRSLVDAGLKVWALDSSPTLVAKFQSRFPGIPVQCARVQESDFFSRKFDAVVAIGLIFLLDEDDQIALIRGVCELLAKGGRFLFTAPVEVCNWMDSTTGHPSLSLGQERYEDALRASDFRLLGHYLDNGDNHYYDAERTTDNANYKATWPSSTSERN